jgi:hypothetical protein
MEEIYLVRTDTGDPEDFWPVSAHRTLEGAVASLTHQAGEHNVPVSPGGTHHGGPGEADPYPHANGGRGGYNLFIHKQEVQD